MRIHPHLQILRTILRNLLRRCLRLVNAAIQCELMPEQARAVTFGTPKYGSTVMSSPLEGQAIIPPRWFSSIGRLIHSPDEIETLPPQLLEGSSN